MFSIAVIAEIPVKELPSNISIAEVGAANGRNIAFNAPVCPWLVSSPDQRPDWSVDQTH